MRMDVRQGDETNEQLQKVVLLMPKSWPPIRKYLLPIVVLQGPLYIPCLLDV